MPPGPLSSSTVQLKAQVSAAVQAPLASGSGGGSGNLLLKTLHKPAEAARPEGSQSQAIELGKHSTSSTPSQVRRCTVLRSSLRCSLSWYLCQECATSSDNQAPDTPRILVQSGDPSHDCHLRRSYWQPGSSSAGLQHQRQEGAKGLANRAIAAVYCPAWRLKLCAQSYGQQTIINLTSLLPSSRACWRLQRTLCWAP